MADQIIVTTPKASTTVTAQPKPDRVVLDQKNATSAFTEYDPEILIIETRGPRGEPGIPGPAGAPGVAGAPGTEGPQAKSLWDIWLEAGNPNDPAMFFQQVGGVGYRFVQGTPATEWHITHPLQTGMPAVSLVDSNGEEMYGDVAYLPPHNLTISFSAPVAGEAYMT